MKKIIACINPGVFIRYPGHRQALNFLLLQIAEENALDDQDKDYISRLFMNPELKSLNLEIVDSTTFRFGHKKSKGYVEYGTIIKVNIL